MNTIYYFGIYIDYSDPNKPKIAQLSDCDILLSYDILAIPGNVSFSKKSTAEAIDYAKQLARTYRCTSIEINFNTSNLILLKQ